MAIGNTLTKDLSNQLIAYQQHPEQGAPLVCRTANESTAFPKLSAAQLELVGTLGDLVVLNDGEYLFEEGDRNVSLFAIKSGEVEIVESSSGASQTVITHGPNDFTGDVDLLTGRPVVVSAIARGRCELIAVPSERLRHLLSDIPDLSDMFLEAFQMRRKLLEASGFMGLRLIGESRSRETLRLREFFYKNHVPHTFFDPEETSGKEMMQRLEVSENDLPVIACSDEVVKHPSLEKVAECLGVIRTVGDEIYDLVIVGAGPSGLAAAVYGASEGLKTLVLDSVGPGGQASSSSKIENFIGFPSGLSGSELANRGYLQALKFGAEFSAPVTAHDIKTEDGIHNVELCTGQHARARCVLVSSGVSYRQLDLEGSTSLEGSGVYYAATSVEAKVCRESTAVIVGGGNSAGQAAMYLAQHAKNVKLVIRGDDLYKSMSSYLCNRVLNNSKIELIKNSEIAHVEGNGFIKGIALRNSQTDRIDELDCSGLFIFIGAKPHTEWLPSSVQLDQKGFVVTGSLFGDNSNWPLERPPCDLETTLPGVFAAGDVRSGTTKRCGFAVGDGSLAIACVHRYLGGIQ